MSKGRLFFFRESLKNMKTSATVTRSSRFVCKKMIEYVDFENADVILELGAGDGVITRHILNSMKPNTKLIVFEILEQFCEKIRQIEDDRLIIIQDSAENLEEHLNRLGYQQVHDVVCAIPFVTLPKELSKNILLQVKKVLRPGGVHVQLHYSTLVKKMYEEIFGIVDIKIVPLNIPPAFLHICRDA